MGLIKNWLRWLGGHVGSMSRSVRTGAIALVTMMIVGGLWLAGSAREGQATPLFGRAMPAEALDAAQQSLAAAAVPCARGEQDLLVQAELLPQARAAIAEHSAAQPAEEDAFAALAGQSDLWSTEAQKAHRWQAEKMATLSRLICKFPAVRSAAVLLDAGSPRRLGQSAQAPSAAVELCMAEGATLTPDLVEAVADLVAGSIAGMRRSDVRIVDSAGRSHWAGEEPTGKATDALASVRQAESHYSRKIEVALDYIAGAIVAVHVQPADAQGSAQRVRAVVTVPRSYLHAMSDDSPDEPLDDRRFNDAAQSHLARLQQIVMRLIGAEDAGDVQVDWYPDAAGTRLAAAPLVEAAAPAISVTSAQYTVIGGFGAAGGALLLTAWMRRRRRAAAPGEGGESQQDLPAAEETDRDSQQADPLGFLRQLEEEQLITIARDEHPQAVALILANVEPAKAAAVLASLTAEAQVQVVKRLASLAELDSDVLRELARGLAGRVARLAGEQRDDGRIGRIAEILHHAGYHTECRVLDGLLGHEPELADSLRTRMFAFDDIVKLPDTTVRAALEGIGGDEIAIALRTAGKDIRKKVLSNLEPAAARGVRREMDRIGPVRLSDVEASQQRIVDAVRQARYGRYVGHAHHVGKELLA